MITPAPSTLLSNLSEGILARIVHYCGTLGLHELIRCGNRLLTHKLGCSQGVPYYCNQNEYGACIRWSVYVLEKLRGLKKVKLISKSEESVSMSWLLEKLPTTIQELDLVAADPLKVWGGDNGRFDWKVRFPDLSRLSLKLNLEIMAEELEATLKSGSHVLANDPVLMKNALAIARSYKSSEIRSQVLVSLDAVSHGEKRHSVPFSHWLETNLTSFPMLTSFRCDQLLVNATQYLRQLPTTLEAITLLVTEVTGVSWLSCFPLLNSLKITCTENWMLVEEEAESEREKAVEPIVKDLHLVIPNFRTGNRDSTPSEVLEFYSNFSQTEKLVVLTTFTPDQLQRLFPKLTSLQFYYSDQIFPSPPLARMNQLKELQMHRNIGDLELVTQFVMGLPQHLLVLSLCPAKLTPHLVECLPRTILDLQFTEFIGEWRELPPKLPPNLTKLSIPRFDEEQALDAIELLDKTSIKVFAATAPICRVPNAGGYGRILEADLWRNWNLLDACLHYSTLSDIQQHFDDLASARNDGTKKENFSKFAEQMGAGSLHPDFMEFLKHVETIEGDTVYYRGRTSITFLDWLQRRWQLFVPSKNDRRALALATTLVNICDVDVMLYLLPLLSPSEWYHVYCESDVFLGQDEFIPVLQWLYDHDYPCDAYKDEPLREFSIISSAFFFHKMGAAIWLINHFPATETILDIPAVFRSILQPVTDFEISASLPTLISLAKHDTRDFISLLANLRKNHSEHFCWWTPDGEMDSQSLLYYFLEICPVFSPFALPLLDVLIDDFGMDPFDCIRTGRRTRLRRKSLRDFFIPLDMSFASPNEWQTSAVEWMIERGLSLEPRNVSLKSGKKYPLGLAHFAANQSNLPLLLLLQQHGEDLDLPGGPDSLTPRQLLPSYLRSSRQPTSYFQCTIH